jgi:hypothetical protein
MTPAVKVSTPELKADRDFDGFSAPYEIREQQAQAGGE